VNSFVIQPISSSRAWCRHTLDFGVARQSCAFVTIDFAEKPCGHAKAWTPNTRFLRDSARLVSSLQAVSRGSRGFSAESTIINHGLALIRTHLAISRSQSQTWLSRTTNAIGSGLNLTSLQSEVGRVWPLEIPSAGPVAGAGIPAGGGASLSLVGTAVPAVRDLGFGGLGTARPTTAGKPTGKMPVQLRQAETGETPVLLFPAGNRPKTEVRIA